MNDIEVAIIAAEDARIAAVLARDAEGLARWLDDDLIYVHSSGAQETKAVYTERVVTGAYDYKAFEIVTRYFRHVAGLVFVNGDNKVDIVRDGQLLKLSGRYLTVWRQHADGWKLLSFHAAPIPRIP